MTTLTAAIGKYPHTADLLNNSVQLTGKVDISFASHDDVAGGAAIARMLRAAPGLDFDVCELPIVNYLAARQMGADFTALPIFPTRRFPYNLLLGNRQARVEEPKDLEGKRVGVAYYGHTDATWARGILAEDYGVRLDTITWFTSAEEPVRGAAVPAGVIHVPRIDLSELLRAGLLDGQIVGPASRKASPDIISLVPDADAASRSWFDRTGVFPALHTIVIKNEVARRYPSLPQDLFALFCAAKERRLAQLESGAQLDDGERKLALSSGFPAEPRPRSRLDYLGRDPLPYGLEVNRSALEMIIRFAYQQQVLESKPPIEDLFFDFDQ